MKSVFVLAGAVALSAPAAFADQKPITSALHCWSVGALSSEAATVTVVVGFNLVEDGQLIAESIRLLSATGGDTPSQEQAFQAARRAVIRCGSGGYLGSGPKALSFGPDGIGVEVRAVPVEV